MKKERELFGSLYQNRKNWGQYSKGELDFMETVLLDLQALVVKTGLSIKTLERQFKLSKEDLLDFKNNHKQILKEIGDLKQTAGEGSLTFTTDRVAEILIDNWQEALGYCRDGYNREEVCRALGTIFNEPAWNRFLRKMNRMGYKVTKISKLDRILDMIDAGESLETIVKKYPDFKTVEDCIAFLENEGVPRRMILRQEIRNEGTSSFFNGYSGAAYA
ncbi:hypothetical protein MOD96_01910 [Bacillus sp. S17B2]|uniref:hypothetical protein n=1 Tax=Bacillus sp. S17B2 TaxID=2918907 RepID=UPI00227E25D4|nr:hypothetical protein [Bacillus sp. S17B2]